MQKKEHDIIAFVVNKLGGDLLPELVNGHPYMRLWVEGDDEYHVVRVNLSSPDLMLKGMGVCPHGVAIKSSHGVNGRYVSIIPSEGKFAMKWYDKVEEIPEVFWACYAEAEGGQG